MSRDANTTTPDHRSNAALSPSILLWLACLGSLLFAAGCCSSHSHPASSRRPFNFQADTLAFPNELVWEYGYDQNGKWSGHPRDPVPEYYHHCFVVARAAMQFIEHARFDTNLPIADTNTYRKLIRRVTHSNTTKFSPESEKIVIPGYPDLHTFSAAQAHNVEGRMRRRVGKVIFQRGHWRIIIAFPVTASRNARPINSSPTSRTTVRRSSI